jgi:hypothetical protein
MARVLCVAARRVDQRRLADARPTLDHENATAPLQQSVNRRQLALALDQLLHATTLRRGAEEDTTPHQHLALWSAGSVDASRPDRAPWKRRQHMAFTREQIRDSIERAGDEHWQALIRHHTDAYPESNPTPGDVARAEAARLNDLGLGDDPNLELVESRVERVEPAVRITHVFEDRAKGTRFETEPFTGYG